MYIYICIYICIYIYILCCALPGWRRGVYCMCALYVCPVMYVSYYYVCTAYMCYY